MRKTRPVGPKLRFPRFHNLDARRELHGSDYRSSARLLPVADGFEPESCRKLLRKADDDERRPPMWG
jgi:hypothetical protein